MALAYLFQHLKGDRCGVSSNTACFTKEQTRNSSLLGSIGNQSVLSRTSTFVFYHFTEGRKYTISSQKSKILLWGLCLSWFTIGIWVLVITGTWLLFCASMSSGRWLSLWGLSRIWCYIWGKKIHHATDFFGFAYTMSAEYPGRGWSRWVRETLYFLVCLPSAFLSLWGIIVAEALGGI